MSAGGTVFDGSCAGCHSYGGPGGVLSPAVAEKGREYMIERVLYGVDAVDDSSGMPAFDYLSDLEIADVVAMLEDPAAVMAH